MEDGAIIINSHINTKGVELGADDIKSILKSLISSCDRLQKSMLVLSDGLARAFHDAGEEAEKAASGAKKLGKETEYAKKQTEALDSLKIHRMDDNESHYDGPLQKAAEWSGEAGYSPEAMKAIGEQAAAIENLKTKAAELKNQLQELEEAGQYFDNSEDYRDVYLELQNINGQIREYRKNLDELAYGGKLDALETELAELESKTRNLTEETRYYELVLKKLAIQGYGLGDKVYDEAYHSLEKAKAAQKEYRKSLLSTQAAEQETAGTGRRLSSSLNGIAGSLSKVSSNALKAGKRLMMRGIRVAVKGVKKGIDKLGDSLKRTDKHARGARMSLGKMLGMSLLFSTVFRALSTITNGIKEGMQNLAQYSDKTNANLSLLMSSLTRLKNSFATAFAPILSVVAPIMSSFIDMISRGTTYVGMFFASLTGQDAFIRAKTVQQDYAASLDKTSKSSKKAAKATKDAAKDAKGSLAPWDELNIIQMDLADSLEDTADVAAPEIGELTPQDMFEEVPIKSSIKNFADKIKKLIKAQDWNGIGKLLGQQINKGLKKVNKAIKWDTVGEDITKSVDAITGIFNALVDEIDWEYMGDTAGEGLNTLFKTLNQLIEKTDWKNLGKGFAEFANGLMDTVEWDEVGKFLGNKIMMLWDTLSGAVHELHWGNVGVSVAETLNAAFKKISFSEIADTLTTGINGAFKSLAGFTKTFEWDDFADNVGTGISDFLADMDWKENGKSLGDFLSHLCTALKKTLTKDTFYDLGKGIGDFLGELPWIELLGTAASLIIAGLGGALEGLWESGLEGKIAAGLTAAFIAVKIADITGIGTLASLVIKSLAGKIAEKKSIETMTKAFKDVISESTAKGATEAAEALGKTGEAAGKTGSKVTSALGSVATMAGALIGTIELAKGAASIVDSLRGGNGYPTELGGVIEGITTSISQIKPLTKEQVDAIFILKESLEDAEATPNEFAQAFIKAFGDMNISSDTAKEALLNLTSQVTLSEEQMKLMDAIVSQLGDTTETMAQKVNLADTDTDKAFESLRQMLQNLYAQGYITELQMGTLNAELSKDEPRNKAQESYDLLRDKLEDMGVDANTTAEILKTVLPDAIETIKQSVDNNFPAAQEKISSTMKTAEADVATSTGNMKKDVDASFGAIDRKSKSTWDNSQKSVSGSLSTIDTDTKKIMGNVMTTVQSYWSSVLTNTNQIWERASKKVETELVKMVSDTDACTKSIADKFTSLKTAIENNLSGMYDIGHNAIIGLNNGMVDASDTLYRNARTIAQNIPDIFRDVLKIHSPSKIMGDLGDYTMEGYYYRLEAWLGKIQNLAQRLSDSMQSALQFDIPSINVPVTLNPSAGNIYPRQIPVMAQGAVVPPQTVRYFDNKNSSSAADDIEGIIKRVLASVQENTGNVDVIQAFRDAMSGMAVYADDKIIGYLQERNQEARNRSGHGILEGGW